MERGSWLFSDGVDRERMLDMDRHLRPVRRAVFAVLAIALVACGPQLGWWTLLPLAMAVIVFRIVDTRMDLVKQPEYALLASWAVSQVIMASSVALSGGPHVPTMAWFAIPLMTLGARFSMRRSRLAAVLQSGCGARPLIPSASPPVTVASATRSTSSVRSRVPGPRPSSRITRRPGHRACKSSQLMPVHLLCLSSGARER